MSEITIAHGDIFRWRYKDEKPEHLGAYMRYHCTSQVGIARSGLFIDTFWGCVSSDRYWAYADAERDLELTKLGNLNDLEKRPEYEAMYYDDDDCVDLNHSNSSAGNFYVRKGATRSRAKMRAVLDARVAQIERDIASAKDRLTRTREQLAAVDHGANIDEIHL